MIPAKCPAKRGGGAESVVFTLISRPGLWPAIRTIEKLRVEEFAGIEFYAGGASVPVQYNKTGSSCGVLLLWSRMR